MFSEIIEIFEFYSENKDGILLLSKQNEIKPQIMKDHS